MDRECPNCHELADNFNWSRSANMCKPCLEQVEICAPILLEACEAALSFLTAPVRDNVNAQLNVVAKLRATIETARRRKR